MGAQQTKERVIPAGSVVRSTRKQIRNTKDTRAMGSNIFTEHSGMYTIGCFFIGSSIESLNLKN